MKLGILGGSFDPVHMGHLILADYAREVAGLDQVLFVPAATSPLKPAGPRATDRQRLEMLRLALGGNESFQISECEIERQGISYTVDTLQAIHAERPDDELFLIVGSDALADFGRWKDVPQICQLALPLVAARRGSPADLNQLAAFVSAERLRQAKQFAFEFPLIEVSSTELRERAAAGRSIRYRTPRAVECYIQNARLYQDSSPG
jgi:nicotinate-nucleotide adenylyltransferase